VSAAVAPAAGDRAAGAQVLLAYSRPARFVMIDRDLLAERYEVLEYAQPGPLPRPLAAWRGVRAADVVVCWFASWHAPAPLLLARLLRRPSILIVGGFDTANMPEIGYGFQQGGIRRLLARSSMRLAGRLLTNSEYSRDELERNTGFDAEVVYHGVPDPFGSLPDTPRERVALTVGNVARLSLERKGLRPFVQAAAHAPDVEFVVAGRPIDDAEAELRSLASANVTFTGELTDDALDALYRRASVYVQASLHEGFGMAVAEAMLAGCIPVVTSAGALPEVVGDTGVVVASPDPATIAAGVQDAIVFGSEARARARERVITLFPLEGRRQGLLRMVEGALASRAARGPRA
jgi:glycosyltransferase involved in cell wall biosynthesis